jgi:hypothetical protein
MPKSVICVAKVSFGECTKVYKILSQCCQNDDSMEHKMSRPCGMHGPEIRMEKLRNLVERREDTRTFGRLGVVGTIIIK